MEKILSFITDSQAGKIKLHYKSQAVPESNDGVVKTAVGDTFQELVVNCPEEAIVMFFAPWCGVCHKLEPHFEAAASRLAHNPNIKFVRIDATEN